MGPASEAGYVTAPIAGEVIAITITTTPGRYAIPAAFAGAPCTIMVNGDDADILFGSSSVAVVYGQVASTATSATVTAHASTGLHLENGIKDYLIMPNSSSRATHFSVATSGTTTATLYIAITGGRL